MQKYSPEKKPNLSVDVKGEVVEKPQSGYLPGDIIFSVDSFGKADHVGIYSRYNPQYNMHYILHATVGKYNSMHESTLSEGTYRVFRLEDTAMALRAYFVMKMWGDLRIPYNFKRRNIIHNYEDSLSGATAQEKQDNVARQLKFAKEHYTENFYRVLKYATRYNFEFPYPQSKETGFTCVQSVVLAFQIADTISNATLRRLPMAWTSDKYSKNDEKTMQGAKHVLGTQKNVQHFERYVESLVSDARGLKK